MDNQQQNCNLNLKYDGKVINRNHLKYIYLKYLDGASLMELSIQYGYNIATIRNFLIRNKVKIRSVKESIKKFHKSISINIDDFLEENIIG